VREYDIHVNQSHQVMKKFARLLFDILVLGGITVLAVQALKTGEITFRRTEFEFHENPVMFVVALLFMTFVWTLAAAACYFDIYQVNDKKVRHFGGNYNLNTFKAIFRSYFRNKK
jgi:hypothetical protein